MLYLKILISIIIIREPLDRNYYCSTPSWLSINYYGYLHEDYLRKAATPQVCLSEPQSQPKAVSLSLSYYQGGDSEVPGRSR